MENASSHPPIDDTGSSRRRRVRPLRAAQTVLGIAILLATLFTALPSRGLVAGEFYDRLSIILTPRSAEEQPAVSQPQLRIGIVAGHTGNDSGAVCMNEDGEVDLTEADVNLEIAELVKKNLESQGFQVDLLNEFDTRLNGYRAVALVSIHNDSCEYINDEATGFKVASSLDTRDINRAQRLTVCLVDRYKEAT